MLHLIRPCRKVHEIYVYKGRLKELTFNVHKKKPVNIYCIFTETCETSNALYIKNNASSKTFSGTTNMYPIGQCI